MRNKIKLVGLIITLFAAFTLVPRTQAKPPYMREAAKFGAKDCMFCHTDTMDLNKRGQWLVAEKARRKAPDIDANWLSKYKESAVKPARPVPSAPATKTEPATTTTATTAPATPAAPAATTTTTTTQAVTTAYKAPDNIDFRKANIMSEGVRLHAEMFSLKSNAGQKLPTIIQAHGWGGTAAAFRRDSIDLANAGYLVINFDYRGWGESDSRMILTSPAPAWKDRAEMQQARRFTAEVVEVRGVVDPLEMVTDWFNVIHWVMGEPMVDTNRIGVRGSSYSGGHIVYVAARDPRIKALVSQVGSLDSRPKSVALAGAEDAQVKLAYDEATRRARGELGYPQPFQKAIGNLIGAPIRDHLLMYAPVEDAHKLKNCASLFIVAEKEELFDNKDHAQLAYERIPGNNKKYVSVPNITHYGIYTTERDRAIKLAIEWFDQYLKGK